MKMNWFKTPKGLAAAATVTTTITLVTICVWNIKTSFNNVNTRQQITKKAEIHNNTNTGHFTRTHDTPFIHPPIHGVDVPFKTYSVDAGKGATLSYKGSKVIIPAGIFCDDKGKDVTGKVNIKYREFHNPIDFFLSGIPMTYDSAGKQYTFESAGMADIRGEKDGMPVMIKSGKSLKIEMVATQKGGHYNLYSLDTSNRKWVFQSANITSPDGAITQSAILDNDKLNTLKKEIDELVSSKPVKPRMADSKQISFRLSADAKDFPELSMYGTTLFEVDTKNKNFNKSYGKVTWNDVTLNRLGNGERYMITLGRDSESYNFVAYPVFDPKDYKTALAEYNKKYSAYKTELKKIKEQKLTGVDISKLIAAASKEQEIEDKMYETSRYV
ncbi:MAG TPA: hypothetical protein VK806_13800, partial [Bacteroidia bacterium]|nr:hypothetical protein [Bacteroidia bacterium]